MPDRSGLTLVIMSVKGNGILVEWKKGDGSDGIYHAKSWEQAAEYVTGLCNGE